MSLFQNKVVASFLHMILMLNKMHVFFNGATIEQYNLLPFLCY